MSVIIIAVPVRQTRSPLTSVALVQSRLVPLAGVPLGEQLLSTSSLFATLLDGGSAQSLASAGFVAGAPLYLDRRVVPDNTTSTYAAPNFTVAVALPPELQVTFGARITLSLQKAAATTLREVKHHVEAATGMGRAQQLLAVDGAPLLSDTTTLGAARVPSGATLVLSARPPMLTVRLPSAFHAAFGAKITILGSVANSLGFVQAKLEARLSVPTDQQSLTNAETGGQLFGASDVALASLGMTPGAELALSAVRSDTNSAITLRVALPESLHAAFGAIVTFVIAPTATVNELKGQIQQSVQVLASEQLLAFGTTALTSETLVLTTALGIRDGDLVTLSLRPLTKLVHLPSGSALAAALGTVVAVEAGPAHTVAEVFKAFTF